MFIDFRSPSFPVSSSFSDTPLMLRTGRGMHRQRRRRSPTTPFRTLTTSPPLTQRVSTDFPVCSTPFPGRSTTCTNRHTPAAPLPLSVTVLSAAPLPALSPPSTGLGGASRHSPLSAPARPPADLVAHAPPNGRRRHLLAGHECAVGATAGRCARSESRTRSLVAALLQRHVPALRATCHARRAPGKGLVKAYPLASLDSSLRAPLGAWRPKTEPLGVHEGPGRWAHAC